MASLEGLTPGATFKDLLQISNTNSGLDGTLRNLEDGEGTVGPVKMSTTGLRANASATWDAESGAAFDFANFTVTNLPSWTLLAETSPTSGSSFQVTGIPASAVAVLVVCSNMDYSTSTRLRMQVMDSSVVQTTGYFSTSQIYNVSSTATLSVSTSVLHMVRMNNEDGDSTQSCVGMLVKNASTGDWSWECNGRNNNTVTPLDISFAKAIGQAPNISGTMNGLEFEVNSGNFAAGTISVYYAEA